MLWFLLACGTPADLVRPDGPAPTELPERSAWEGVNELDGVERLFTGPFRCLLPDGTDASFFPNRVARGEPDLRATWSHAARVLQVEGRHMGTDLTYVWPYSPFTTGGSWLLATPTGVLACRPGHETAPEGSGDWIRVRGADGVDLDALGKLLATRDRLALVVLGPPLAPAVDGVVIAHRDEAAPRDLAQFVANGLQRPVRMVHTDLDAPIEIRLGSP